MYREWKLIAIRLSAPPIRPKSTRIEIQPKYEQPVFDIRLPRKYSEPLWRDLSCGGTMKTLLFSSL